MLVAMLPYLVMFPHNVALLEEFWEILLMEEIPNNHLGYINLGNSGINYQPQLVRRISDPSTVLSQSPQKPNLLSKIYDRLIDSDSLPCRCFGNMGEKKLRIEGLNLREVAK